ncbi:DEAD/DEAH box helicase [Kineosporia sp. A_224]|uniref:DEAD/DEAH box helicase n=1 Tax=Kineosporia sp. A_224 TaxID=1962180 RepID=UPI000B4A8C15|nr:DEAD/DEAH box helicase [Kineosporia sp. A_224]
MTDWTRAFGALLPDAAATDGEPPAPAPDKPRRALFQPGLQLDLVTDDPDRPATLRARPVVPKTSGGWQVSGAAWSSVGYTQRGDLPRTRRQRRLLTELLALARSDHWYSQSNAWLDLTEIDSRRVWDLLCELREAGLPFVAHDRPPGEAVVHDPVTARLDVRAVDDGLDVTCGLHAGERSAPGGTPEVKVPSRAVPLGEDGALAWWVQEQRGRKTVRVLHVAPVPPSLAPHLAAVLHFLPVHVPAADVPRFTSEYLPRVPDVVTVRASGDVPRPVVRTRLRVLVTPLDDFALEVRWVWDRGPGGRRDTAAEGVVVDAVRAVLPDGVLPAGGRPGDLPSYTGLPNVARLAGMAAVRFAETALPALEGVDDVSVEVAGELPRYRPAQAPPVLTFDALRPTDRDWFDLTVSVSVDGEGVPFVNLFTALVKGKTHLVLPNGVYFPLRGGQFADLIALIEESRGLEEAPEGTLRVSRYDAGVWADLERIGTVEGQALEWSRAAGAVTRAPSLTDHPLPAGLTATLRPYQRAGFGWLATLYANGLGGVLADDMGLGKTLQTLALMCHVREQGISREPFLVVAPTSVVGTWRSEAEKFAPGLRVTTVTGTAGRRGGVKIGDLAAEADVVVTSYALFRLEHAQYRGVGWAGLVLDEAQSVKNHASVGYGYARTLGAPFVLAISGTPVENNLMELWAVVSLVAPGLLGTPKVFNDVYRLPIERARDGVRLAALRRRIAPLVLRRTKEQVAQDLPEKTEQVLEIELSPRHRAAYQAFLARERRKVLGLVEDMPRNAFKIFRSLTLLRQAALDIGLVDADLPPVPSTKLDVLVELVDDIVAEGHRVLVFSQFTRFLRAARERVTAAGHEVCYLDGSTTRRDEVVASFRSGTAPVFLISLKAGGTGLTLTEADYCIVLDPWWNPATENQAVDRTHRIGQTRNVVVYRLVAKGTIEEKVMALKAAKEGLAASVLDDGELSSTALTEDDVRRLMA